MTEKPKTYDQCYAAMRRTWYVWQMAAHKTRLKPETKRKMQREFEESVLEFAACIADQQYQAQMMEAANGN